jgi:FSR family fosmidomycin resistance protein-like MFS transporter
MQPSSTEPLAPAAALAAPTAPATPRRIQNRAGLALLACSHAVDDLYQSAVPAILPFLVLERGYSYAAAAGITFAATIVSSVAQPAFGLMADRRSVPWLPPLSLLIAGGGIALVGLGSSYWWVWAVVALSGLGVAAYHPSAARATRLVAGPSAQGMSWFALGGHVGLALGPILATPLLLTFGLRGTPLLFLPALVMAIVLLVATSRSRIGASAPVVTTASGTTERDDDWRSFSWLTGLVVLRSIGYFGLVTMLALYVIGRFHTDEATGSAALTTMLIAGAVASVPGGWLADRHGRLPVIRLGYALLFPALVLLLSSPSPWVAILAAALLGIALYLPFAVQTTLGQDYLPNRLGTASGVTLGLAIAAGGMFAPVFGVIADHSGLHTAIAVLLVLSPLALLISLRLPEPRHAG